MQTSALRRLTSRPAKLKDLKRKVKVIETGHVEEEEEEVLLWGGRGCPGLRIQGCKASLPPFHECIPAALQQS